MYILLCVNNYKELKIKVNKQGKQLNKKIK